MGLFRKTVTYQYWNVATTPLIDKPLPDSFHDFAVINDAVNSIDYFKSIEYLEYYGGRKGNYNQLANRFKKSDYYGGFAEVDIGNNYVPAGLVKARINPSDANAVTITSSKVTALDYGAWVKLHLIDTFSLDPATNQFVDTGVTFQVDFSTANSTDNTVEVTNVATSVVNTIDLPPEPTGHSYNVTYTVTTTAVNGQGNTVTTTSDPKTWSYEIGSGLYPELDTYTTIPENDPTVFQIMPPLEIRKNNAYTHEDVYRHKDFDDYAEMLGLSPKDISDAFKGQSDMDKLDHVTISHGVDMKAFISTP